MWFHEETNSTSADIERFKLIVRIEFTGTECRKRSNADAQGRYSREPEKEAASSLEIHKITKSKVCNKVKLNIQ